MVAFPTKKSEEVLAKIMEDIIKETNLAFEEAFEKLQEIADKEE